MSVVYPLFAFERDDQSMFLITGQERIAYHCEAIDIENGEYVFWDSVGEGVCVKVSKNRVSGVTRCNPAFPLVDAFALYAQTLNLSGVVFSGTPKEIWEDIQQQLQRRPKKSGFLSKLFSQ
jgi:hypothetical protein